ncbi:MAG TPA: hypothetical protein VGT61_09510 [Thermomicrobiales bacterium]|jgi:quercetin dioxygenase-like cupin family protein|nr:hypothetical protein [Thermomicrobiales bacterium]
MGRTLVQQSSRVVHVAVALLLLFGIAATGFLGGSIGAQDATPGATPGGSTPSAAVDGALVDVALDPIPAAPSFLRLIRITMAPGSSIPMRSHPGPKIDRVQSGTLTALVRDEATGATVVVDGGAQEAAPSGDEIELVEGDVIVLPIDTFYAFRNDGDEPVVLLSSIMLPAGHQRPPGITYADGEPASDAYEGVTNQILGDGVATALPTGSGRFVIDEVTITQDEPLAASSDITMLSSQVNGASMTVDAGRVQVTRTVQPGPQRDAEAGSTFTLIPGDGIFFPDGHADITVPESSASFIRVTLTGGELSDSGASTGIDGTPIATGPGEITFTDLPAARSTDAEPASTPSAATRPARNEPTNEPTIEATPPATDDSEATVEPTAETGSASDGDTFVLGSTVVTTEIAVNVRAEPAANAELVTTTEDVGARFVVIGEPVDADGFTWIPVQSLDDPTISGWVVVDFVSTI